MLVRQRKLPCEQAGNEDEQVAQTPCARKRKTHGRIEPQGAPDQNEASFLNAQRAGYKERGAAECLNQGLKHDRFSETDRRTEKIERQPDLERGGEALQRLPDEQIAQHNAVSSPDQLDRLVDA